MAMRALSPLQRTWRLQTLARGPRPPLSSVPRRSAQSSRAASSPSGGGGDGSDAPSTSFRKASDDKSTTISSGDIEASSSGMRAPLPPPPPPTYATEAEAWSRVQLLRARLREATAQEDYVAASKLRDALAAAVDALPLSQRHCLAALDSASSSSSPSLDRASALLRAADQFRPYAFAQLAAFLHDTDDAVAAAAERALATAFRVPPDEAAAARMDEGDAALEAAAAAGAIGGSGGSAGGIKRRSSLSRAVAAFSRCADSHPDFAEAHNAKATALYLAGDPEASLKACEVVLDLNPHHFSCAAGAGMCFIALGKHKEALACLEVALDINPRLEHVAATASRMRRSSPSSTSSSPSSSSRGGHRLPWLAAREAAARAKAEEEVQQQEEEEE